MKKVANIAFALVAMFGIAGVTSCEKSPTDSSPAAPTSLAVSAITNTSATFSWEGSATTDEISVGADGTEVVHEVIDAKSIAANTLTRGTAHTWRVRAVSGEQYSEWVDGAGFTTEGALDPPTSLAVSGVTKSGATFSWEGTLTAYDICISTGGTDVVTEAVNGKTFTTDDLERSTAYSWKVRPVEGDFAGGWVEGDDFTTSASIDPPTSPAVSSVTKNTATFTWEGTDPTYELSISAAGSEVVNETVNGTTFTCYTLTPETAYTWRVRTNVDNATSDWVAGPGFTTSAAVNPPTNLVVLAVMQVGVSFQWAGSSPTYEISISRTSDNVEVARETVPAAGIPYTYNKDGGLPHNYSYSWKVRGKEGDLYSAWVDGPEFSTWTDPVFDFNSAEVKLMGGDTVHNYQVTLRDSKGNVLYFDMYRIPASDPKIVPNGRCIITEGGTGDKQLNKENSYYISGDDPGTRIGLVSGGSLDILKQQYGNAYRFDIEVETETGISIVEKYNNIEGVRIIE
jgi:hypothetical protein